MSEVDIDFVSLNSTKVYGRLREARRTNSRSHARVADPWMSTRTNGSFAPLPPPVSALHPSNNPLRIRTL